MTYKCFICKKEYKRYGWYRKHMVREYKIFTAFLVTTIIIIPTVEMGGDFRWLSQSLLKN